MTDLTPVPAVAEDAGKTGILVDREHALMRLTLDRPLARNALTRAMKRGIAEAISRCGNDPEIYAIALDSSSPGAFCGGAELADFIDAPKRLNEILAIQAEETRLLWQIECCIKPSVALIDGLVMGSGAGLSMFCTHRVASENYSFGMPETGRGWFPGAGATHFLGRMPDSVGIYLGMSGARVGRSDAYALGLVTHCIDGRHFDAIRAGLADADPIDPLLDERHEPQGEGGLMKLRPVIARCFGWETVEEIVAALEAVTAEARPWAQAALGELSRRSPSSLKLALRQFHSAANMDLKAALETEFRMMAHCLALPDFMEGVRVTLIDKGAPPRWQPPTLAEVTPAMVAAMFAPAAERDLVLPPRPQRLVALS